MSTALMTCPHSTPSLNTTSPIEFQLRRLRLPVGFNGVFEGGNRLKVTRGAELSDFEYSAHGAANRVHIQSPMSVQGLKIIVHGSGNSIAFRNGGLVAGLTIEVHGDHNRIVLETGVHLDNCAIRIRGDTGYGNFRAHRNHVAVAERSHLSNAEVDLKGSENRLAIGRRVYVVRKALFLIHGYQSAISVGEATSIQEAVFSAGEIGTRIDIGRDCMLAHGVVIDTGDHHPIYNVETMDRLNSAANIRVGRHVWLCDGVRLAKRAAIGDGCIVGAGAFVKDPVVHEAATTGRATEQLAQNAIIVGSPARVVKCGVDWSRGMFYDDDNPDAHPDARAQSWFIRGCLWLQRGIELCEPRNRKSDRPARSAAAQSKFAQAVTFYHNAVKAKPDFVYAHSALGSALKYQATIAPTSESANSLLRRAEAAYRTALRFDSTHEDSQRGLAEVESLLSQAAAAGGARRAPRCKAR